MRSIKMVKAEPSNKWAWYEVAKNILAGNEEDLFAAAKMNGITINEATRYAIMEGYYEWKVSR